MKKLFIFLIIISVFLFSACREEEISIGGDPLSRDTVENPVSDLVTGDSSDKNVPDPEMVLYEAKYVRTYWEERDYPLIESFSTLSELNEYDRLYAYDKAEYDERFFEENMLIMVIVSEGSGSNRHELIGIGDNDVIYIKRILPEVGTCDMAEWHIIIEIPKQRAEGHEFTAQFYSGDIKSLEYSYGFAHISAYLPEGFGYEIVPFNEENNNEPFGIEFYPLEDPDFRMQLFYNREMIGFGGEGIVIERFESLRYDITSYCCDQWEMYVYEDLPGVYIFWVRGGEALSEKYEEEIELILSSACLSLNGIIGQDRALELAKEECTVDYIHAFPRFDPVTGHWHVDFVNKLADGTAQSVVISPDGKIVR